MIKEVMINGYTCLKCNHTYIDKHTAEVCCKQYYCKVCGVKTPAYHIMCGKCREKEVFETAEKVSIEDYHERFPDNKVFYRGEYFSSPTSCLKMRKWRKLNAPEYIWGTDSYEVEIDADSVIEDMITNSSLEDFEVEKSGYNELREFLKEWNQKYGTTAYMQNDIAILIPKEAEVGHEH